MAWLTGRRRTNKTHSECFVRVEALSVHCFVCRQGSALRGVAYRCEFELAVIRAASAIEAEQLLNLLAESESQEFCSG